MTGPPAPPEAPPPWPTFRPYVEFVRGARGEEFAGQLEGGLLAAWAKRPRWKWQDALMRADRLVRDDNATGGELLWLVNKDDAPPVLTEDDRARAQAAAARAVALAEEGRERARERREAEEAAAREGEQDGAPASRTWAQEAISERIETVRRGGAA
jgi:hypothetical protein